MCTTLIHKTSQYSNHGQKILCVLFLSCLATAETKDYMIIMKNSMYTMKNIHAFIKPLEFLVHPAFLRPLLLSVLLLLVKGFGIACPKLPSPDVFSSTFTQTRLTLILLLLHWDFTITVRVLYQVVPSMFTSNKMMNSF